jgi:hypothetical protein
MKLRDHIAAILDREIPKEYRRVEMPKAAAAIQALCDHPNRTLLLHGTSGTGKTLLAWVIYRRYRVAELLAAYGADVDPDRKDMECTLVAGRTDYEDGREFKLKPLLICPESDERLLAEIPCHSARVVTEPSDILRHRYDRSWLDEVANFPGVLLVDDVGCVPASDWVVEALYHIANWRRAWTLPTVYSTNWSQAELSAKFSPAISSRLCGGEVIQVTGQDRRLA